MAPEIKRRWVGSRYGAFAYGSLVLTCFAAFFPAQHYVGSPWMVLLVFALAAVYFAVGILSGSFTAGFNRKHLHLYYPVQVTLAAAIVLASPSRGFMGIIVLPVVSQAIFDLPLVIALGIALLLFTVDLGVIAVPYGWSAATEAFISYSTGFVFTIAFSLITKQALKARETEARLRCEVETANQQLRAYALQAEELATTRERNRLAREIHDGVGHYLTVVKTQLDAAEALMASEPDRARESVVKAARLAGEALDDVRRSVGSLRTDQTRPPLPDALRALTLESALPVTVRVDGEARPLLPAVEHALFRSAQEGLTNVRKHSGASTAEVVLDFRPPDRVRLAVTDNGRGAALSKGGGFGLQGISERIELLGGRVESGNRREGGFALRIEVPA